MNLLANLFLCGILWKEGSVDWWLIRKGGATPPALDLAWVGASLPSFRGGEAWEASIASVGGSFGIVGLPKPAQGPSGLSGRCSRPLGLSEAQHFSTVIFYLLLKGYQHSYPASSVSWSTRCIL